MISFAQFRPEKDHDKQLKIWKLVLDNKSCPPDAKFILIGTCRGPEDEEIVQNLKVKAKDMNILDKIEFKINVTRNELYALF